jgi:hypothetical protein
MYVYGEAEVGLIFHLVGFTIELKMRLVEFDVMMIGEN